MRRLIFILGIAAALPFSAACAQLQPPNDSGVAMGHLHLLVKDVEANKKFWIAMGGSPVKFGTGEVLKFPGVLVLLTQGDPSNGSVGSIINHVGFNVPSLPPALTQWKAAGIAAETTQNPGQAWIYSPDKLRIEILENPAISVPIQFHHVHYYPSPPPVDSKDAPPTVQMQTWYAKIFGAKPGRRKQWEAADLPGANLTFTASETPTVKTDGRVLDHIGFEVKDLEAFCKKAEAGGIHFDTPYTKKPELGIAHAFLTDPWGTKIELTEGLNKL
jgi:catechol 2,3-dioxygenase-like lactoylglutathione lyase family enzyme